MFISSHDIAEIELLANWVGLIDQGRLCLSEPLETLRARFRRIDLTLPAGDDSAAEATTPDALLFEAASGSVKWIDPHFVSSDMIAAHVHQHFPPGTVFAVTPMSLRDIFVAVTRVLRKNPLATI